MKKSPIQSVDIETYKNNNFISNSNYSDINKFYLNYLISILKPSLIDGITELYNDVLTLKSKNNIAFIPMFKEALKNISFLKQNQILSLVIKIKDNTQTGDLLEKTIKSVAKSFIILLSDNNLNIINKQYQEKINTNEFIYRCYIEFSQSIYYNVDVFMKYIKNINSTSEEINYFVYSAINSTIFKTLPMSEIMDNYLSKQEKKDNEIMKNLTKLTITNLTKSINENTEKILSQISSLNSQIDDLKVKNNSKLSTSKKENTIILSNNKQSSKVDSVSKLSNDLKNIMSTGTFDNDLLN